MERIEEKPEQCYKRISTGYIMDSDVQSSALHLLKTYNYLVPSTDHHSVKRQHDPITQGLLSPPSISSVLHRQRLLSDVPYTFMMPINCLKRKQRSEKNPIPIEQKDEKYFEKRKRNNEAAKKSRDARKIREDRIALKAALLERENSILKSQVLALQEEVYALAQILCLKNVPPNPVQ